VEDLLSRLTDRERDVLCFRYGLRDGVTYTLGETAKHLGLTDPFDVQENLEGGIRYLQTLLERYDWDLRLALASYNAGPTKVQRYKGVPPYPETRQYIWRVTRRYQNLRRAAEAFRQQARAHRTYLASTSPGSGPGGQEARPAPGGLTAREVKGSLPAPPRSGSSPPQGL